MRIFDYSDLDGRTLRLFLAVLDEGSVTRAATRLGITQSAVSHTLDKLRLIMKDQLFVRVGRGIAPTRRAEKIAKDIRLILAQMRDLTEPPDFDLAGTTGLFTIGASAYQRELLLPALIRELRIKAPGLNIKILDSSASGAEYLRKARCDLLIIQAPPEGMEFVQKKLFDDHWVCFFDPASSPPDTLESYLARPHAKVVFTDDEKSRIDTILAEKGLTRSIPLRVSSFSALPGLMLGTDLVITLPSRIKNNIMREFSTCPVPIPLPLLPFYLVWHLRDEATPLHRWIRSHLETIARQVLN